MRRESLSSRLKACETLPCRTPHADNDRKGRNCTRWLLLVGCLTLTGCSTVTNLGGSEYELGVPARAIYGGTRLAAWEVGCCFKAMLQGYPGEEYMIIPSATVA